MIFVTVGTGAAFDELVEAVDALELGEEVLIQIGNSACVPRRHPHFRFKPSLEAEYARADLIVCKGGAGTLLELCRLGKRVIAVHNPAVPLELDLMAELEREGCILACYRISDLPDFLNRARDWRPRPYLPPPCSIHLEIRDLLEPRQKREKS